MAETVTVAAKSKKARSPPAHPPFVEMITDAIVSLKERTGSSQYAITKFVEEKHQNLPQSYKKLLLNHLKKLVEAGKLVKVKNSFKIPSARSAPAKENAVEAKPKKSAAAVAKAKEKAVAKPKSKVATKPKAKVAAKAKTVAKPKAAAKPKGAAKAARTPTRTSPGKKAKAKKPVAAARAVRKVKSVKSPMKKPKSVKSPAKKAKK